MEINKDTKLHLNTTIYFDSDGYECDSLEEARSASVNPEDVRVIKKQNCYCYSYDELTPLLKEEADSYWERDHEDFESQNINRSELHYIVNSKRSYIIMITAVFNNMLKYGMFSIVAAKGEN